MKTITSSNGSEFYIDKDGICRYVTSGIYPPEFEILDCWTALPEEIEDQRDIHTMPQEFINSPQLAGSGRLVTINNGSGTNLSFIGSFLLENQKQANVLRNLFTTGINPNLS